MKGEEEEEEEEAGPVLLKAAGLLVCGSGPAGPEEEDNQCHTEERGQRN